MKLIVASQKDGFRRCGRAWSGRTEIDAGEFAAEQIAALKAEPMLAVTEVDAEAKKTPPAK